MVKSAVGRIQTYRDKNNVNYLYLLRKAQLRNHKIDTDKGFTINALKDEAGKTIIDSYNLTARNKAIAWQAWRALYYKLYRYQRTH